MGSWEGALAAPRGRTDPSIAIAAAGVDTRREGAHELPRLLGAVVQSPFGATLPRAALRWYDARGAELARGRSLDLSRLAVGQHQITAVAAAEGAAARWLIERTRDGRFLLLVGDQKKKPADRAGSGSPEPRSEA